MSVRLRFARHHCTRNNPLYSLVAIRAPQRQTAKPLELLGSYNPRPIVVPPPSVSPNGQVRDEKEWGPRQHTPNTGVAKIGQKNVEWNLERVRYWLSQGALPTKPVERLLIQAGVISASRRSLTSVVLRRELTLSPPATRPQRPTPCRSLSPTPSRWSRHGGTGSHGRSARPRRSEARSPLRSALHPQKRLNGGRNAWMWER